MRKVVLAVSAAAFLAAGAIAAPPLPDDPGKAKSDSAAQKAFDDLAKEYTDAYTASRQKKGPAPNADEYAAKFKAIATKYAKDPIAANAWAWIAQNRCSADLQAAALDAIAAKYLASPAVSSLCLSLPSCQAENTDKFLETVAAKSPDHEAQGRATYALARRGRSRNEGGQGKPSAADLKKVEDLLEKVVAKFADVKYANSTLGEVAKGDLFVLRNLSIGKTAPEITGQDENGKAMKLSDFRGKVVMLDFWGFW